MNKIQVFHLKDLFEAVQLNRIFPDGKTFVDCTPQYPLDWIREKYVFEKKQANFDLKTFIHRHFDMPNLPISDVGFRISDKTGTSRNPKSHIRNHIESVWQILTRQPDAVSENGSLLALPHPYIVPGGRFGEVYYWDSYFTMLGLRESGRVEAMGNMIDNFAYLIDTVGYVPNGNRTYYIGRSQPPFFALMVQLLADIKGDDILIKYLPQLEREYQFWMKNSDKLTKKKPKQSRTVKLLRGQILNRYYDENDTPRPESYREDVELSHQSDQNPSILFRHLRAGAESGWDYSARWFKSGHDFSTIHTTDIVPIDLNCLLYFLEKTIAKAHVLTQNSENTEGAIFYTNVAEKRKKAILKHCWNAETQFFYDFDSVENQQKTVKTLAAVFPLFFKMASRKQAKQVAETLKNEFLKDGGLVSTTETTGQQWDAPNGWSPLQWMAIIGLENYGQKKLAKDIAKRWIKLNTDVFKRTGKLMEKYNVVDTHLEAGGGEYDGQDGFGWTNGVLLALMKKYS